MVNPAAACDFRRSVAAAVVHHEIFDLIHADNLPRQRRYRGRQGLRLVEARDLDDQLQRIPAGFSTFSCGLS